MNPSGPRTDAMRQMPSYQVVAVRGEPLEDRLKVVHLERHVAQPQFVRHGVGRTWFVAGTDEARQFEPGSPAGRPQHDDLGTGVRYANDGVQELALQNRPALRLEAQPDKEGRHRVEISDGDADVIEVPDGRHAVHPLAFVRQVRFSWVRLFAETARPWQAPRSRVCIVDGVNDHRPLRPLRRPLCQRHYMTRWNTLICGRWWG